MNITRNFICLSFATMLCPPLKIAENSVNQQESVSKPAAVIGAAIGAAIGTLFIYGVGKILYNLFGYRFRPGENWISNPEDQYFVTMLMMEGTIGFAYTLYQIFWPEKFESTTAQA